SRRRALPPRPRGPSRAPRRREASAHAGLPDAARRDPGDPGSRRAAARGPAPRRRRRARKGAGRGYGLGAFGARIGRNVMTPQQLYLICFVVGFVLALLGALGGTFHWPFGGHGLHGFHVPHGHGVGAGHGGGAGHLSPHGGAPSSGHGGGAHIS